MYEPGYWGKYLARYVVSRGSTAGGDGDACYLRWRWLRRYELVVRITKYDGNTGKQRLALFEQELQGGRIDRNDQLRFEVAILKAINIEQLADIFRLPEAVQIRDFDIVLDNFSA